MALARKYGFDMLQVYDDLMFKPAWSVLFTISLQMTPGDRFTIGPGVVNPYHMHPALIATNLACLSEETSGRAFLMIGRGAFHDLVCLTPERPLAGIRDCVEIVGNILSGGREDYNGKVFRARAGVQLRWKAERGLTPRAQPPIWIGSWGARTCELAGRMRSVAGVMISSVTDPRYVRFLSEKVAYGAKSVRRDPREVEVGCVLGTIVSEDRDEAQRFAREASAVYLPYLDPMPDLLGISKDEVSSVRAACANGDFKLASSLVSDRSVDSFKLWGTPDDLVGKIEKLIENGTGVERINFGFGRGPEDIEAIELLGRKVLLHFHK